MPTLVLSTWSLPASPALADAARGLEWSVFAFHEGLKAKPQGKVTFYGGTDQALAVAAWFNLTLIEPPFDLLAKLPSEFRLRAVEYGRFGDLHRLKAPTFVKPADALNKAFDAGTYSGPRDIRGSEEVDPQTPVLVAEPVEWLAEFRCFVLEREVVAWSPYISFGRPTWKPHGQREQEAQAPENVRAFCERLFTRSGVAFPPALVMDVGLIDERGWAVVEFNPAWCSGLLGADPRKVLAVLDRACQDAKTVSDEDQRWVMKRAPSDQIKRS